LTPNIIEWNEHEAEVARATGSLYVDLYSLFGANDRVDWPDGVHPSNKGAQRIASAIKNALNGI
jgi:lysophospholipase L1-like esterase